MVEVRNLTKDYSGRRAIEDISFSIEDGEVCGLLGPNGAGKSTIMNIMAGYISCAAGRVVVDGYDVLKQPKEAKARIGYLPEIPPLYPDLTPKEYLEFVGRLRGVPKKELGGQLASAMERTGVAEVQNRLIKTLSKGFCQRVGLAGALMGDTKLIILDEPTAGLDPAQVIEMRSLIADLKRNHTVLVSSHILSEIQAVCDRVLIIADGRVAAAGTPRELAGRLEGQKTLVLTARGEAQTVTGAVGSVEGIGSWELRHEGEGQATVAVLLPPGADLRPAVSEALARAGCPVIEMQLAVGLEDVFLQMVERNDGEPKGESE